MKGIVGKSIYIFFTVNYTMTSFFFTSKNCKFNSILQ